MRKLFFAIIAIIISITPAIAHEIGMQHDHHDNWETVSVFAIIALIILGRVIYKKMEK
ncbi:MAG: hypothetical protein WCI36_01805 [bacterium]